ncbi:MAG: hypothetical protein JOY64_09570 [Alphaproteobacteria bacterium]|nr:hypothetical protein [Alphaproteobacteria bacterium]MBV8407867.1 hypothetical protein [Alphaproteobacteria bacterium]
MSDANLLQRTQNEIWSVDRQIKDLNDIEIYAAQKLCRSIKWLDAQPKRTQQLETARAAERNLRELAMMALHVEEAYAAGALAHAEDIDLACDLERTNKLLGVCYLAISVSKIMDVVAQFYGGPAAKLITDFKTPLTDMGKPALAPVEYVDGKPQLPKGMGLSVAQTVNATALGLTQAPGGGDLVAIQKEIGAVIDIVKDVGELISTYKDMKTLAANTKKCAAKGAEKAAKLLDLVSKLLTAYDSAPGATPDAIKQVLPDVVKKLPAIPKAKLDAGKKWLAVAKYTLEALVAFYQFLSSWSDGMDSHDAAEASRALANQQLARTGGGMFEPNAQLFAQASNSDFVRMMHSLHSAADAHDMGHIALVKIRELRGDIEKMSQEYDRQGNYWSFAVERASKQKAGLKESDTKLEAFWQAIANDTSLDPKERQDMLFRIDDSRGKIARLLNPAPAWIAPRGRFGPRVGPQ